MLNTGAVRKLALRAVIKKKLCACLRRSCGESTADCIIRNTQLHESLLQHVVQSKPWNAGVQLITGTTFEVPVFACLHKNRSICDMLHMCLFLPRLSLG